MWFTTKPSIRYTHMREKLDYIYYRFYQFQRWVGNGLNAEYMAVLQLEFTVMVNIFAIQYFLYGFWGIKFLDVRPEIAALTQSFVLMLIGYLLFIYKSRHKKIIKTHRSESPEETKRGNYQILLYFIGSVVLFGLGMFSMIARNNGMF